MKVHEYLKLVEEQIHCKSIWEDIRLELLGHMEEDTEYFQKKGMSREEAVERAVKEMGDPVETGIALDKVHRTRLDVKLLLFFIGIDLLMMVLMLAHFGSGLSDVLGRNLIMWRGMGIFFLLLFAFGKYREEYFSRPYQLWLLFFIFSSVFLVLSIFSGPFKGTGFYITDTAYQSMLFGTAPGFALLTFYYRKGGYGEVHRLLGIAGIVCLLSLIPGEFFYTFLIILTHVLILTIAVRRGWFHIKRREFLIKIWSVPVVLSLIGAGIIYKGSKDHLVMRSIRAYMELDDTPGILMRMFGSAGIWGILLVILLLGGVFLWMLHDIRKLTNQYCNIICTGVLAAFVMMVLNSVLAMMGFGDMNQVYFPFFSVNRYSNGCAVYVYYILVGTFLHMHRHDKVLPKSEMPTKRAA